MRTHAAEEVEEGILDGALGVGATTQIYRLKRDLLSVRRAVASIMVLACAGLYAGFRKSGWL